MPYAIQVISQFGNPEILKHSSRPMALPVLPSLWCPFLTLLCSWAAWSLFPFCDFFISNSQSDRLPIKPSLDLQCRVGSSLSQVIPGHCWLWVCKSQVSQRGHGKGNSKEYIDRCGTSQHGDLLPLDPSQPGVPLWHFSHRFWGNIREEWGAGCTVREMTQQKLPWHTVLSPPSSIQQK